jgi:putative redox protein
VKGTVRCETITPNAYPVTIAIRSHTFSSDVLRSSGGIDSALGPHDYFDAALATCKAETAMWYAKRHAFRASASSASSMAMRRVNVKARER